MSDIDEGSPSRKSRSPERDDDTVRSPRRTQPQPIDRRGVGQEGNARHVPRVVPSAAPVSAAETPLPTDTPTATSVAEDIDMGEDYGVRVLNTPAIPQPPLFKGSTKTERRVFMREYQQYTSLIEALQSTSQRPFLMPSHGDVIEAKWVAWFMEAHNEEPVELDALKRCLQIAVQFDMKILDANSRVSRMLDNLMRALKSGCCIKKENWWWGS
ncbi:hypothetical protein H310_08198 [Aphanomyces invadans]|uniref:Uncharacterized protein n=1 Tax=Aphanomyces invadans TaxID=157072 RepID=A0A024TZE6_9STRA|nr:hypothetical protein H310_08198 [Aphanomyces invadans]ETV99535.1 hypothetical protein H310_08198 [Aphanomyces invadans]|eukprot:XP_008872091.1 hypothetical protein H310_08198 [Aphanomyces invadans]